MCVYQSISAPSGQTDQSLFRHKGQLVNCAFCQNWKNNSPLWVKQDTIWQKVRHVAVSSLVWNYAQNAKQSEQLSQCDQDVHPLLCPQQSLMFFLCGCCRVEQSYDVPFVRSKTWLVVMCFVVRLIICFVKLFLCCFVFFFFCPWGKLFWGVVSLAPTTLSAND